MLKINTPNFNFKFNSYILLHKIQTFFIILILINNGNNE